jgi:hypothetical protein
VKKSNEKEKSVEKSISQNVNVSQQSHTMKQDTFLPGSSAVGMYHARLRQYEYNKNKRRSRGVVRVDNDWQSQQVEDNYVPFGTYQAKVPTFIMIDEINAKSSRKNQEN